MDTQVRQKLEMVARVREFVRTHLATEAGYAPVLARLEERFARAEAIATQQVKGRAAARAARVHRKELRRILHFQLLRYLTAVGTVLAVDRLELSKQFELPDSHASNASFLTAARTLIGLAEEQKDALVEAGMVPALLDDLRSRLSQFESAAEAARTARRDHIGARAELGLVTTELVRLVKILDGITRYRFGTDPEKMAEWRAVRRVPGTKSVPGPEEEETDGQDEGETPPPGGVAPAA